MAQNEQELINTIRGTDQPVQSLLTALAIVSDYISQNIDKREAS